MNIQQRLAVLERQLLSPESVSVPIKPKDWTDGEYTAVVIGLGLMGANIPELTDVFMAKYQTYIDQIRADYNERDITPDKPIVNAQPITFSDTVAYYRAIYFGE